MRCDKLIYLCQNGKDEYDEESGDYDVSAPIKIKRYANINDMSDEKITLLFGQVTEGALTVRLNAPFSDKIDYVEIDNVEYLIKQRRKLRNKETLQVVKKQ